MSQEKNKEFVHKKHYNTEDKCMVLKGAEIKRTNKEYDVCIGIDYYPGKFAFHYEDGRVREKVQSFEDEIRLPAEMYWKFVKKENEEIKKNGKEGAVLREIGRQ